MSESTILTAAAELDNDGDLTLEQSILTLYGHGVADETGGDMDGVVGHLIRVERWIVQTNSQGFTSLHEFDTEAEAKAEFDEAMKLVDSDE